MPDVTLGSEVACGVMPRGTSITERSRTEVVCAGAWWIGTARAVADIGASGVRGLGATAAVPRARRNSRP
jgi:hypothetical protein